MWSGEFYIGNCFAVYIGHAGINEMHRHASYQLILCHSDKVDVANKAGTVVTGKVVLICPLEYHSIRCDSLLTTVYLEPQSDLAFSLLNGANSGAIDVLDKYNLVFEGYEELGTIVESLSTVAFKPAAHIDPRVLKAMDFLCTNVGVSSIAQTAKVCGLSESRLRQLTREQLGVPLATWHLWCKLQAATDKLKDGYNLTAAAHAAGFSDQAHFSRTMRRMFGITPTVALNSLL